MLKKLTLLVSGLVVLAAVAYLGIGYKLYDQLSAVHPDLTNAANTPAQFHVFDDGFTNFDTAAYAMPNFERVRLPSRTPGLTLAGWYVPGDPNAPAVVVTHGLGSCKCGGGLLVVAGMLHRHGYNVLLYDLRNHGESDSDGGRTAIGNKEYLDVLGAWDWLQTAKGFPPRRIGLYGDSLGAGTTLIAFGEEPRVAAAMVDSPYFDIRQIIDERLIQNHYPTFLAPGGLLMARLVGGVDLLAHSPQEAVTRDAGRPIFVVHGTADQSINIHHSRDLASLAAQTGANVTTWFPEGVGHVQGDLMLPAEYEQRMATFYTGALGGK